MIVNLLKVKSNENIQIIVLRIKYEMHNFLGHQDVISDIMIEKNKG